MRRGGGEEEEASSAVHDDIANEDDFEENEILLMSDSHRIHVEHILRFNDLEKHISEITCNPSTFSPKGEVIFRRNSDGRDSTETKKDSGE